MSKKIVSHQCNHFEHETEVWKTNGSWTFDCDYCGQNSIFVSDTAMQARNGGLHV